MVTKRYLKSVIVVMVSVFMSLTVLQGVQAQQTGLDYQSLNLLPFTGNKQLVLGEFDHLGRATSAHIQLQDKDEPKQKREPRLTYNPVGWHNYKMSYGNKGKTLKKVDEICYNLHKNLFLLIKEEVRRWSDGQRNSRNDARD